MGVLSSIVSCRLKMKFISIRRRNPFVLGIIAVALCLVLWIGYERAEAQWPWVFYWSEVRQANIVIAAVNSFQARYGRLPNNLAEVGLEDSETGPIYYDQTSDGTYIVWFGTTLGESAMYESSTKKWH